MTAEQQQKILSFFQKERQAVLSYSAEGQPMSSVIDFSETRDLEVVFITLTDYRKYGALSKNRKVALCFGGGENITVQYEGAATEVGKLGFLPYLKYHIKKNPVELKFSKMRKAKFFKVAPAWIRYSDFNSKPNEIFEVKL